MRRTDGGRAAPVEARLQTGPAARCSVARFATARRDACRTISGVATTAQALAPLHLHVAHAAGQGLAASHVTARRLARLARRARAEARLEPGATRLLRAEEAGDAAAHALRCGVVRLPALHRAAASGCARLAHAGAPVQAAVHHAV